MEAILDITAFSGFTIRLALAIVLGFIVGFERQWTKHQAGILTNVIVCVGAYAYTAFSCMALGNDNDTTRVASQVVSGIGFLGAGLIIRDGTKVSGLSTAATIWTTAAIGILCTLDNIYYAVIVAAAIVIVHLVLHPFSDYINKKSHYNKDRRDREETMYKISILCKESSEIDIRSHLIKTIREKNDVLLHNLESNDEINGDVKIKAYITTAKKNNDVVESIIVHIGKDEGIISAGWKITE